ncbi:unnamed protein product [Brassicogethes aeneus]|uniref:UDP-glucuronosyltransferase n=1 Tax=Brassicogethes aeneus TaxID=1431903 RepID=A0A9P0AS55_BRAAE|nr:unnamed protein product [Brassicogethes aeneus]
MRLIIVICATISSSHCANILGVFVSAAYSHHASLYPMYEKLATKGHNVTLLTAFPKNLTIKNLHEIDISFVKETYYNSVKKYFFEPYSKMNVFEIAYGSINIVYDTSKRIIEEKFVRDVFRNDYDVMIIENKTPLTYFGGLVNKAPIIGVSSMSGWPTVHDALGNPIHPVLSPNFLLTIGDNPTFIERLSSVTYNIVCRFLIYYYDLPRSNKIARKYFGSNVASLDEVERNMSLGLFTKNFVTNGVTPVVPSAVEVSFMNIKPKQDLPEDIQEFMDKSKKGIVFLSLGSFITNFNLTEQKVILNSVLELPYDVLWKSDTSEQLPSNIMVKNWFPQQDLLGHPKLKVFVTQGGLHSIEEALYNAVPMVLLPVIADQGQNSKRVVSKGLGKMLDIMTVSKDILVKTVIEVAEDNKYKEAALNISKILKDEPMFGVDKAVWWVEYVIRHKGARHLRSGFVDMPFYQYYLLDVLSFITVLIILCVVLVLQIIKFCKIKLKMFKLKQQ